MRLTRLDLGIAAALAVGSVVAFGPAVTAGFIGLDDPDYVFENPHVLTGMTTANVAWAWKTFYASNWHPLTWLSLQLNATLFGPGPASFHATNVILHAANAVLLFLALRALTGAPIRSAFVAALFAWHPLRVESVVWVTERKDVLSAFFGFLALWAYAGYVRRPSIGRYLLIAALLALSLLAKPMLVTLPCLLLVLDWWPLERDKLPRGSVAGSPDPATRPAARILAGSPDPATTQRGDPATRRVRARGRLVLEKLPLLILCLSISAVTLFAQQHGNALPSLTVLSTGERVKNALVAYSVYLQSTVWPFGLAPFYPYPQGGWPVWRVVVATVIIAGLTGLAVGQRRRRPYLLAGWLWYLGTLVPVIGLVQVGTQAYADRYSYFPLIGPCIALVWTAADWTPALPLRRVTAAVAALLLAALTWYQSEFWHDDLVLWPHTLQVTDRNAVAHNNFATALERARNDSRSEKVRRAEAITHFKDAIAINPKYGLAHFNLALALEKQGGRPEEIFDHYASAVEMDPFHANARLNLGVALVRKGMFAKAEEQFRAAIRLNPELGMGHLNLGSALAVEGHNEESIQQYEEALRINPDDGQAHDLIGLALEKRGDFRGAAEHLRRAARLRPGSTSTLFNLGRVLEKLGQPAEAIGCFREALKHNPKDIHNRIRLADALAQQGSAESTTQLQEAFRINPSWPEQLSLDAWQVATSPYPGERNGEFAVWAAESACKAARPTPTHYLDALAAAYAETGRFPEAAATAEKAIAAADAAGQSNGARIIAERLALYREGRPFHQPQPSASR